MAGRATEIGCSRHKHKTRHSQTASRINRRVGERSGIRKPMDKHLTHVLGIHSTLQHLGGFRMEEQ